MKLIRAYERNYAEAIKKSTTIQPHQQRVADKLNKSGGVLAFHGMGSGKTLTSIYATQGEDPDVIVPASLRPNYHKEIAKHTTGGHKANVISYEAAAKMTKPRSRTLVMDEPQAIANSETKRSQAIRELGQQYERRLLKTGTPIRNHPADMAPLINIVKGEEVLPVTRKAFEKEYVQTIKKKPGLLGRLVGKKTVVSLGIKNADKLEEILRGHVDYHMPDKTDFPTKTTEIIEVPMSAKQQRLYDYAEHKLDPVLAKKIRNGLPLTKKEHGDLTFFLGGVRQIGNTGSTFGVNENPKLTRAAQEMKKLHDKDPNFRGMAYSNYLGAGIHNYKAELEKHGIKSEVFDGTMNDKERQAVIDRYNNGKNKVLLVSGAGAQGLDLKGTKLVQILEPHWNSARVEQAEARAIRYKSHEHLPEDERNVHVQTFHSTIRPNAIERALGKKSKRWSADQALAELNKNKDHLNDQFLDLLKKVGSEH